MKTGGFSLVEILFSVFLLSFCSLIVVSTMPIATSSRLKSDFVGKATSLGSRELENVRACGYSRLTPDGLAKRGLIGSTNPVGPNTYSFTSVGAADNDSPAQVLPGGRGTVLLEDVTAYVRRAIVTVSWTERDKTRSIQIGTMLAKP